MYVYGITVGELLAQENLREPAEKVYNLTIYFKFSLKL